MKNKARQSMTDNPATDRRSRKLVHALAACTTCLALLPIGIGAVVTTMDAGMAFPDWPTSHGQGMFQYPWLKSAGDEFVEHGHRLAGMLIGMCSLTLLAMVWIYDRRPAAKWLAVVVVVGVIGQGILGGVRVLADDRVVAMIHGNFAAWVFTAMGMLTLLTSRRWREHVPAENVTGLTGVKVAAGITVALVFLQSLAGGMIRHLGLGLHEHLGGAVLVLTSAVVASVLGWRTRDRWIRAAVLALGLFCIAQISLGVWTWAVKFGLPAIDYVAVQHSGLQVFVRTAHTVVGMLLLMSSANLLIRVFRVSARHPAAGSLNSTKVSSMPGVQAMAGGSV